MMRKPNWAYIKQQIRKYPAILACLIVNLAGVIIGNALMLMYFFGGQDPLIGTGSILANAIGIFASLYGSGEIKRAKKEMEQEAPQCAKKEMEQEAPQCQ